MYVNFFKKIHVRKQSCWITLVSVSALDLWLTSEEKTASKDEISWALEKKGTYTTSSMYRFLSHRGVVNTRSKRLWKSKLPMKLKVFAWLVFHNRIQTGVELKKRHWKRGPAMWDLWCP